MIKNLTERRQQMPWYSIWKHTMVPNNEKLAIDVDLKKIPSELNQLEPRSVHDEESLRNLCLMAAVIEQAVYDARKMAGHPRYKQSFKDKYKNTHRTYWTDNAIAWFLSDSTEVTSFNSICEFLNLDKAAVLAAVFSN